MYVKPFHSDPMNSRVLTGIKPLRLILVIVVLGIVPRHVAAQSATPAIEVNETEPVVHALCGKRVALLGESRVHGFGETLEFKAELVRRLIEQCHYDALFIESGIYDYINIEEKLKSGEAPSDTMISAAIGGLWGNKEVQSLVPFLREKMMAGNLILGGLDDQIGAGTYASREMASDLVRPLQAEERSKCLAALEKHLHWQYTDPPYGPTDKAKIVGCLDQAEERLSQPEERYKPWAADDKAMIGSLKRDLDRDFPGDNLTKSDQELRWYNDRDRSMYLNFQWLYSRLPKHSKVIVWTATVHLAKTLSSVSGFEGRVPFGSYVRQDFGARAFSLGFSAYSGEYEFLRPPVRQLDIAPVFSLEGQLFAHGISHAIFLSRGQLRKYGSVPARPLGTDFKIARWDQVVDGMMVFRKERAPMWLRHN